MGSSGKNKGKNFPNNSRGQSDHHSHPPHSSTPKVPVSTPASAPASPSLAASSSSPIAVPNKAPQHARGETLDIGHNRNKEGAQKVGNTTVGEIGAKACQQNGGRIGFNTNEGENQTIGDVTIA